jgi:phenylacetate-CoA ligase
MHLSIKKKNFLKKFFIKKIPIKAGDKKILFIDKTIVNNQLNFLLKSEKWPRYKMYNWQFKNLKKLLIYADKNIPYYSNLFKKIKFSAKSFSILSDLKKIPILDKAQLKKNFYDFFPINLNKKNLSFMTSGGSTGNPLKILMNKEILSLTYANTLYYLKKSSTNYKKSRSIRLHGDVIKINRKRNIYWLHQKKKLNMSVFHLNKDTIAHYIKAIKNFKPNYIHAYPSAIYNLLRLCKEKKILFPKTIKKIFCDSETLFEPQIKLIKKMTKLKIYNIYGHTEGCAMAITIKNRLFFLPQLGIVEFIKNNTFKNYFDIVVTGFNNYLFPLIRYKTQDICEIKKPFFMGSYSGVNAVVGRSQEVLYDKNNNPVPIGPLLFDYNINWTEINNFQIFQKKIGKIIIFLELDSNSNKLLIKNNIINLFYKIFSDTLKVEIKFKKKIRRTKRGKFKYFIQKI